MVLTYKTGHSLTIVSGKRWQQMRKLLTPAFHADILKPYTKLFQESTRTLLVRKKWSDQDSHANFYLLY